MFTSGLRERQEERLRSLADFPERDPHPVVEIDLKGLVTYQNAASRELFGDFAENSAARTMIAEWAGMVEALRREPHRLLTRRLVWKGHPQEAHGHLVPDRDRIRIWFADIAERVRDEDIANRFRRIANSVHEFLTLINRNYVYEAANDAYCRAHRLRPEALLGKRVAQVWGEKVFQTVIKGYVDRCFEGHVVCYQIWIEFPELGRRYFDVSYYPHRAEDGSVTHAVVLSRDITHVITAEERVRRAEKHESLGLLARGVVAELDHARKVMTEKTGGSPDVAAAADRLASLADGLRTYYEARRETRDGVDVNAVLEETLEKAAAAARPRPRTGKELKSIPPAPIDRASLARVFQLLLANAVESFEKGADPRISVESWQDGEVIHVGISDNGRGIPAHDLDRIFEPFYSVAPPGGQKRSGLGLTICRNILQTWGGTIEIKSTPGRGTQVVISLPVGAGRPAAASRGHAAAATIVPQRRAHVVVVDDEASIGSTIQHALADEHDVTVFTSSREAFAFFEKVPAVDVVLCDLMMPEMSGMELYAAIERRWPEHARRIVFLSGGITKPEVERFLNSTSNRRLAKPIMAAGVRQLVNEIVAEERLRDQTPIS
jgi:PAS domain S-box-containing protein